MAASCCFCFGCSLFWLHRLKSTEGDSELHGYSGFLYVHAWYSVSRSSVSVFIADFCALLVCELWLLVTAPAAYWQWRRAPVGSCHLVFRTCLRAVAKKIVLKSFSKLFCEVLQFSSETKYAAHVGLFVDYQFHVPFLLEFSLLSYLKLHFLFFKGRKLKLKHKKGDF